MSKNKLTEFGKFLRKIRVDNNNEMLKEMASRLKISSGYLSAIERGRRPIPDYMKERLMKSYELNDKDIEKLDIFIKEGKNHGSHKIFDDEFIDKKYNSEKGLNVYRLKGGVETLVHLSSDILGNTIVIDYYTHQIKTMRTNYFEGMYKKIGRLELRKLIVD